MAVDREQIRRDADLELSGESRRSPLSAAHDLARHCLALLAELEQAEHDYRMAKHQRDNFERIAREQAENKHALWLWRNEHESRLAKVPALVEALRRIARDGDYGAAIIAVEALAEWEQG